MIEKGDILLFSLLPPTWPTDWVADKKAECPLLPSAVIGIISRGDAETPRKGELKCVLHPAPLRLCVRKRDLNGVRMG